MEKKEPILELRNISKRFGGLKVLEGISTSVSPGSVHGIIGPNGAGKSTLFNIITGLIRPNSGEILFKGGLLGRTPLTGAYPWVWRGPVRISAFSKT